MAGNFLRSRVTSITTASHNFSSLTRCKPNNTSNPSSLKLQLQQVSATNQCPFPIHNRRFESGQSQTKPQTQSDRSCSSSLLFLDRPNNNRSLQLYYKNRNILFNYGWHQISNSNKRRLMTSSQCLSPSNTNTSTSRGPATTTSSAKSANASEKNKPSPKYKKKPAKSSEKEFSIKDRIGEHDLTIKITKMQHLLEKGKTIVIMVKHGRSVDASATSKETIAKAIQKKLEDGLQGCYSKIRKDFSNEQNTKITILPIEKAEKSEKETVEE